jgi:hypothetical protein
MISATEIKLRTDAIIIENKPEWQQIPEIENLFDIQ